jgi:hypothetical protein
MYSIVFN